MSVARLNVAVAALVADSDVQDAIRLAKSRFEQLDGVEDDDALCMVLISDLNDNDAAAVKPASDFVGALESALINYRALWEDPKSSDNDAYLRFVFFDLSGRAGSSGDTNTDLGKFKLAYALFERTGHEPVVVPFSEETAVEDLLERAGIDLPPDQSECVLDIDDELVELADTFEPADGDQTFKIGPLPPDE